MSTNDKNTAAHDHASYLILRWLLSMAAGICLGAFLMGVSQPDNGNDDLHFRLIFCGICLGFGWMIMTACEVPQHCILVWTGTGAVGTLAFTFFLGGPYLMMMGETFPHRLYILCLPLALGAFMGLTAGVVSKLLTYLMNRSELTDGEFPWWL